MNVSIFGIYMSHPQSNKQLNSFVGIAVGMLVLAFIATLQLHFVYGQIELQKYIVPLAVGALVGWLLTNRYNSLVNVQQQLAEQHEFLKMVLDGAQAGVWDWNPETGELSFDERWCKLIGYKKEQLKPNYQTWESLVHPDDLQQALTDINNHLQGKTEFYSNVHRMRHKDGHWVYILDRGRVMQRDPFGKAIRFTGTHTDISRIKEVERKLELSNEKLQQLSFLDGLTGLKNRRGLDKYINQQWSHWQRDQVPFCALMIDIDFFKQYNDFYGHLEGDECLKKVAKVLMDVAKRPNDIAVRYGGEEFLVIYSGVDLHTGIQIAQQLKDQIEALEIMHEASTASDFVTVSIGVSGCDVKNPCESFIQPIDNADQQLYLAKKRGRNQVACSPNCKND